MITIVIIASNSENTIKDSLKSATFADEVILYLNDSTDKTEEIASNFDNVRVVKGDFWGFGKTKNYAVSLSRNRWVFVLDSDEIITDDLKEEILKEIKNPKFKAYFIPRLNSFWGKDIKYLGLYPDYSIRLFDKTEAKFNDRDVHESVICNCKKGYFKNYMLHLAYNSIEEFISKQNRYSSMGAKPNRFKALFSPSWTFFKLYFLKLGFLEGWNGFIIAKLYSQYTFWKYIKG